MKSISQKVNNSRYEQKSVTAQLNKYDLEMLVKLHPAMFSEIYYPRYVNNLYLDSLDLQNYFENVNGLANRLKIRVRWYGELFVDVIDSPVLELKIKRGSIGRKESYPLLPIAVDKLLRFEPVLQAIQESEIPRSLKLELGTLSVSLLNRYQRKYFVSQDRRFRITIDSGLEYYHVRNLTNSLPRKSVDPIHTVIELKYGLTDSADASWITQHFPFRISRNSKYVSGLARTYFW